MSGKMGRLFRKRIKVRQLAFVREWLLPEEKSSKQENVTMYEINLADRKMLREMVQEAINPGGDAQRYMMADLTEEMELRYEYLTGHQTEDLKIRIQSKKELYSLVRAPTTPPPSGSAYVPENDKAKGVRRSGHDEGVHQDVRPQCGSRGRRRDGSC